MRPQPAGSRHPVSQPLLQARASLPPSLPQDTAFLLDLHLDLMAARADASPQLFCLASEILFILQGRLFCFFFKARDLNMASSQNSSQMSPSSWHSPPSFECLVLWLVLSVSSPYHEVTSPWFLNWVPVIWKMFA